LLPSRSVGVSPMPTTAALPRILMVCAPLFVLQEVFQWYGAVKDASALDFRLWIFDLDYRSRDQLSFPILLIRIQ
jgi:hypothetical protein